MTIPIKTKIITTPDGKVKTKIPLEDIKKAYCEACGAMMEVDQDGTCIECGSAIAYPAIGLEQTKFEVKSDKKKQ